MSLDTEAGIFARHILAGAHGDKQVPGWSVNLIKQPANLGNGIGISTKKQQVAATGESIIRCEQGADDRDEFFGTATPKLNGRQGVTGGGIRDE
jgi:hypothetical protein